MEALCCSELYLLVTTGQAGGDMQTVLASKRFGLEPRF